jgi:hypothetical protein
MCSISYSQLLTAYRSDNKWGYKNGESIVIASQYDTALAFDQSNRIAVIGKALTKRSLSSTTTKKEFTYSLINSRNQKLYIHPFDGPDSICEFSLTKNMIADYMSAKELFAVGYAGKKFLFNKSGKQVSGAVDNLHNTNIPTLFTYEIKEKTGQSYWGLIDENGKQIIPAAYSRIVINPKDSIIVCCTAGLKTNGSDDLFSFSGQRKSSSARHIDYAYRNFTIYKLHEPEISYIIQNNTEKKETALKANWAYYLPTGIMIFRQGKDHYFFYKLKEDKKIPFDGRLYWLSNLDEDED